MTELGVQQALGAGKYIQDVIMPKINSSALTDNQFTVGDINIYYSDFKRTMQTALNIAKYLGINASKNVFPSKLLRERYYGKLDRQPYEAILDHKVFEKDYQNIDNTYAGLEPISAIASKFTQFINQIEQDTKLKHAKPKLIIVCSHGDNMRIYQSLFENIPLNECHNLKWYGNARVRDWTAMALGQKSKASGKSIQSFPFKSKL